MDGGHMTRHMNHGNNLSVSDWAWVPLGRQWQRQDAQRMPSKPTTLQHHSSRLIDIHHLLHDRLKDAPELGIGQAGVKGYVQGVVSAVIKPYLHLVAGAWEEEVSVPVKAYRHHPAIQCNSHFFFLSLLVR